MVQWKLQPHHLQPANVFTDLPDRLRRALAALVGAPATEIVLANSASYGLHLLANGLELGVGDEVIVAANDFPSDILPWLHLERRGVIVRQLRPAGQVLTAGEIADAITERTRAVCLTWVHSFSGHVLALDEIGRACRNVDALFVVNGSQGVGGIPISVGDHPIDALISVGFKWLCGPYGTGFCWLGSRATERLHPTKLYWLTALSTEDLEKPELDLNSLTPATTAQHDIFGTHNEVGLTTVLNSPSADLDRVVVRTDQPNVSILPAGPIATNPSELLGSLRMRQVIEELRRRFDVVLLDSPPLLSVTDSSVLAAIATGSVLVLRPNKTQFEELGAAVDALSQARKPIHGVIMNQVKGRSIRQLHAYPEDRVASEGRWRVEEPATIGTDLTSRGTGS